MGIAVNAGQISTTLRTAGFHNCAATVVGYGFVGKEYVKALRRLGVRRMRVCSRSAAPMAELAQEGLSTVAGGFDKLNFVPEPGELGIIGTPCSSLIPAAQHLIGLGFRKLLIEKPVAWQSAEVERFAAFCVRTQVDAAVAYNRVAYPAVLELLARGAAEGGFTSCRYTFTEMVKPDWPRRFRADDLARWGFANSLHVLSLAHCAIGMPGPSSHYHAGQGRFAWHEGSNVLTGAGVSERGIPFSYHADWGAADRWSVELHTAAASYRLCPLEELRRKTASLAEWEKVPLDVFDPGLKVGFAEELAVMLKPDLRELVPMYTLSQTAALARFGEAVFGYAKKVEHECSA